MTPSAGKDAESDLINRQRLGAHTLGKRYQYFKFPQEAVPR
jgi:hypothetical protein